MKLVTFSFLIICLSQQLSARDVASIAKQSSDDTVSQPKIILFKRALEAEGMLQAVRGNLKPKTEAEQRNYDSLVKMLEGKKIQDAKDIIIKQEMKNHPRTTTEPYETRDVESIEGEDDGFRL